MSVDVEVEFLGVSQRMTQRAALDRLVRDQSIKKGGSWLRLWEARQARDRALQDRIEAYHQRSEAMTPTERMRERVARSQATGDALLRFFEAVAPGLLDTQQKLRQMGLFAPSGKSDVAPLE